ncbi:Putative two-component membrane permease complex subunit SMU_746c [Paenibacillus plantiphilus]|uniref:Two-component membrane permease complex subunit SMU_746c n=1 Tax=Paenibacillus plantiphilus TaxID=2905650 RepID=A0ABM9CGJ2_9BACL|nr:TIGR03943 family protein [Paenibacillus plantiphilus]CAH1211481.1 Putative two-component membrane permease complex subunit SMU_746c [Paenibacillus plantiphilus]
MSPADRKRIVHHLIRAVILTGFAMYIVFLVRSDNLTLYIAPRMTIYVKLSAIGLYATAIYQLYAALQAWAGRKTAACECNHEPPSSITKNILIYGMFVLPLVLGFTLPDAALGSSAAAKKGVNFAGAEVLNSGSSRAATLPPAGSGVQDEPVKTAAPLPGGVKTDEELDVMFPADEYTEAHASYGKKLYAQEVISVPEKQFIETLTTLDLFRQNYIGKTVEISGFVHRQEGMTKNQFALSRFAMNCCSADALPYGLMISYPRAATYNNDVWLKVRGELTEELFDGNKIIVLKAKQLQAIAAPESPYIYPDYDFGL